MCIRDSNWDALRAALRQELVLLVFISAVCWAVYYASRWQVDAEKVLKLKALEAMQKVADGKATKIIIPSELQGFAGLASGIAETVKETK